MRRLVMLAMFASAVLFAFADNVSARGRGGCRGGGCHGGGCYGCYGGGCYGGGCYGGACHGGVCHGGVCQPGGGGGGGGKYEQQASAWLVVHLPADATLTVDGHATTSTSATRTFRTPELPVGQTFGYTVQIRTSTGEVMSQQVTVRGGQQTTITFPATSVTQR
jgi:uncharacterized protein (TIGR03000 family)